MVVANKPAPRFYVGQDAYVAQANQVNQWQVRCENASESGIMFTTTSQKAVLKVGDAIVVHIDKPLDYSLLQVQAEIVRINCDYPNQNTNNERNFGARITQPDSEWYDFISQLHQPFDPRLR